LVPHQASTKLKQHSGTYLTDIGGYMNDQDRFEYEVGSELEMMEIEGLETEYAQEMLQVDEALEEYLDSIMRHKNER